MHLSHSDCSLPSLYVHIHTKSFVNWDKWILIFHLYTLTILIKELRVYSRAGKNWCARLASHQVVHHNFMNSGRKISPLHQRSTLMIAVTNISVGVGKIVPHIELAAFQVSKGIPILYHKLFECPLLCGKEMYLSGLNKSAIYRGRNSHYIIFIVQTSCKR